jgi:hypothetical protein
MPRLKSIADWFEQRLQIGGAVREAMTHRVPRKSASWWYVFGSAALTLFILQVFTGIMLALIYVPSAAEAWNSLQFLNHGVTLGWFLRAVHGWGSNFMVAVVLIHLCQVFLFGAYKFPRELTWMVGVFLLLMTLGMAFTGQVLRFDQDAYWGLGIGASITGRIPFIGGYAVHMLLGGRCRRNHVGRGIAGLPRACRDHFRSVFVEAIVARGAVVISPSRGVVIRGPADTPAWLSSFSQRSKHTLERRAQASCHIRGVVLRRGPMPCRIAGVGFER